MADIIRLIINICCSFFALNGLFLCSIGEFNQTKKTEDPVSIIHMIGEKKFEIDHRENNHNAFDKMKQRKCVFE